ncbi:beta-N-acetylglucosaminidase domain-containing protein [Streptomyces sp. NPDC005925]|uniref:beta-N-acetylglucosaminidase domain-containing protein n=1 Tax=Streptomyces sp. NPDC005925 TaxID=3157172 RepID=UPI00340494CD
MTSDAPLLPTPRSLTALPGRDTVPMDRTVHFLPGPDPRANALAEGALRGAGARIAAADPSARGVVSVVCGGPAAARALAALGVEGPAALPSDGYVLAVTDGRVVLAGSGDRGTYYAAQTLRQLLAHHGTRLPPTVVRDWPATPLRGVVEGFYGIPWSHRARLDQLDFYAAHKMNVYVYSPKDDPYLREKWREPYPAEDLARLRELVERADERHVAFVFALSPGLSVRYGSDADARALIRKFASLWEIGVRSFSVPLDDISYTEWNCPEDAERFGTGGGAAGTAQAHLLNRVNREFIRVHEGARPLQMVPTEYADADATPYKAALAGSLDADVLVGWTGVAVIPATITVAQAARAREAYAHEILLWDNHPVNDFAFNRLFLGPFDGREKGLPGGLAGFTANPMVHPAASKPALATGADYSWNDEAYDPAASWRTALRRASGGDSVVEHALRAFADVSYGSIVTPGQAPELASAVGEFWAGGPAGTLEARLRALHEAPAVLRGGLPDRGFVEETGPWLDAAGAWAAAALAALRMVVRARAGDAAGAQRLRSELVRLEEVARSFTYTGLADASYAVLVGEGVLDGFLDDARHEADRALGLPRRPKGMASLRTFQDMAVWRMTDGVGDTYFRSANAVDADAYVGVDLHTARPLRAVRVAMGTPDLPRHRIRSGVVECSRDGAEWTPLTSFDGPHEVLVDVPAGTHARYVRARATRAQQEWLAVREFTAVYT